jgi:MFS transporter, DHA1 family, multidrug resistance protein B
VLAALFCLVSGGSDNLLYPVILPLFRRTLAFSDDQLTLLISISAASATVGSLVGGFLADRFGRRKTMAAGAVLLALGELAFVAAQPHWGRFSLVASYQVVTSLASGVLFAATLAFCMDITNPRLAATHFQIYMALLNVRNTWAAFAGGHLAERIAAPTMFTLGAALELAPILLLLPLLDPRKAVYGR